MNWKIIHPIGACEPTLKDREHLRVEVEKSCLEGSKYEWTRIQSSECRRLEPSREGIESWGMIWSDELSSTPWDTDKQVFDLHLLRTESHQRLEEWKDGPRAMLLKLI